MCDKCDCCHVPDHGACDTFEAGRNGRCVYCDHAEACHPGDGQVFNLPLGVGRRALLDSFGVLKEHRQERERFRERFWRCSYAARKRRWRLRKLQTS